MSKTTRLLIANLSVVLVALLAATPALADGEPAQPLSGQTTHLVVTGIVVAAIVVAAGVALFRIAMARRRSARRARTPDEGRP